jgi:hypothetical protein
MQTQQQRTSKKPLLVAPTPEDLARGLWPAQVVARALGVHFGTLRSAILAGRVPGERLPSLMGAKNYKRLLVSLGAYIRQLEAAKPQPTGAAEAIDKLIALWERDTKGKWSRRAA